MDAMKHFLSKLGKGYSHHKKLENQHGSVPSSEESVNEVVQTVMTQENEVPNQDLSCHVTGENELTELFDHFAGWMLPLD